MKVKFTKIFFFSFILISAQCLSQNGLFDKNRLKIQREVHLIDSLNISSLDSIKLLINDSINVNAKKFNNRIATKNILRKSNTNFEIKYYLKNGELFYIKIEEQSLNFSDLKKHTEYYISKNKISDVNYYRNMRICLPISLDADIDSQFGYNKNLSENFMKKYVFQLYKKINETLR